MAVRRSSREDSAEDEGDRPHKISQSQGRKLRDDSGQGIVPPSRAGAGRRQRMNGDHREYDVHIAPAPPLLASPGVELLTFRPGPGHKVSHGPSGDHESNHKRQDTVEKELTPRHRRRPSVAQHTPHTSAAEHPHPENHIEVAMYSRQRKRVDEASERRRGRSRSLSTRGQHSDEVEGQLAAGLERDQSTRDSGEIDRRDSPPPRRARVWGDDTGAHRQPRPKDDPW